VWRLSPWSPDGREQEFCIALDGIAMLFHTAVLVMLVSAIVITTLRVVLLRALDALRETRENRVVPLPVVSVIRPVRGVDPGLEANLRAGLRQQYPGLTETIFVVDSPTESAIPVIEQCIRDENSNARIIVAGEPPPQRTGKLHAMIRGLAEARTDAPVICFADSDTRPGPTVLRDLVTALVSTSGSGAVFARTWGLEPPQTAGDAGYSFLLDAIYAPQAALTMRRFGGLPFIMGQTMVLRRDALEASGGLVGSEGELVDDMNIGARMAACGYRNMLVDAPVAIVQKGLSWSELQMTAVRWLVYGRTGIPFWPFNVPAAMWTLMFVTGLLGAVCALATTDILSLGCFVGVSAAVVAALSDLRRRQGNVALPHRLWWTPYVCLALVPWWFMKAHFAKSIVWRGRVYEVDDDGRLQKATVGSLSHDGSVVIQRQSRQIP
jgi:ceramide glucosyltransferase